MWQTLLIVYRDCVYPEIKIDNDGNRTVHCKELRVPIVGRVSILQTPPPWVEQGLLVANGLYTVPQHTNGRQPLFRQPLFRQMLYMPAIVCHLSLWKITRPKYVVVFGVRCGRSGLVKIFVYNLVDQIIRAEHLYLIVLFLYSWQSFSAA